MAKMERACAHQFNDVKRTKHRAPRLVDNVKADTATALINVGVKDLVNEAYRRRLVGVRLWKFNCAGAGCDLAEMRGRARWK